MTVSLLRVSLQVLVVKKLYSSTKLQINYGKGRVEFSFDDIFVFI